MAALPKMHDEFDPREVLDVLIIDDDRQDREFCKHLFALPTNKKKYNLIEAETAREGLRQLEASSPDCILLDYQLPQENGLEFLNKIRAHKENAHAAIIMITGKGDEMVAVEAMKQGVVDYLTKGELTAEALERSVANAVDKARLQDIIRKHQDELERSNRELADFCHTVSHDLKAPLRKIKSFCELLHKRTYDKLDKTSARYIDQIMTDCQRMNQLVQDLLTYSKIMNTEEPIEAVDMNELTRAVLSDLEILIREQNATVNIKNLPVIDGYSLRLRQLLQNLIANAIKFRGEDAPTITIRSKKAGAFWQISVEDNGIGMEAKHLEDIFAPFKRIHPQDQYEGSGIGLSICQKVTEMHKGKIWVESLPGQGSTFHFTLPMKSSQSH